MRIIDGLIQGSQEWHAHRATARNASEAAAMLGVSDYMTRAELLRIKHSRLVPEIDAATQRRFDEGHAIEAFARPLAKKMVGELYPITAMDDDEYLSASMDGFTLLGNILWECKTSNAKLRAAMDIGDLPDSHWPQVEQGLLISGAEKCLFTISDGTVIGTQHMWYESKPERRAQLLPGWRQFDADLAAYEPQEVIPAVVAAPISDLPALNIQISGSVVASNLIAWKDVVIARIGEISTDLQTDQDFATAESTVKFLDDGERRIDLVKSQAQAQASDIDAVFRAMDEIKAMMRVKRLELDKLVKARKENIRGEIMQAAEKKLAEHIDGLNKVIGKAIMPVYRGDFTGAIKGKRTVTSLHDACDLELARCKIETNAIANRIQINLATLCDLAGGYQTLFPDAAQLALKMNDDLRAIIKARIAEHQEAERSRMQAAQNAATPLAQAVQAPSEGKPQEAAVAAPQSSVPSDDGTRMKIGDINARLFPVSIDAVVLKHIGFEPVGAEKNAKLFRACDFADICAALIRHIGSAV